MNTYLLEQKAKLWARWRSGEGCAEIAQAMGKWRSTIMREVRASGGITPHLQRRAAQALTFTEREEISRGLSAGNAYRHIARKLGRAPSTISREIDRHGGRCAYRAVQADARAYRLARRPKRCRLAMHAPLRQWVIEKLQCNWSPEQISKWLALRFPGQDNLYVSHETIYRSLFIQARGALKQSLTQHLRTGRKLRRAQKASHRGGKQGQIIDAISIRERPAQALDRAIPGHWEGDLLCGSPGTQIATLVERHSRFVMLVKLPTRDTVSVVQALSTQVRRLPLTLKRSLTWDRGLELAGHKQFTIATDVQVYFCDPRSPWQRGSNENTNGLLRQYFPKGSKLSAYSQQDLNKVAQQLNERPRKTLGFQTPADTLSKAVAATS